MKTGAPPQVTRVSVLRTERVNRTAHALRASFDAAAHSFDVTLGAVREEGALLGLSWTESLGDTPTGETNFTGVAWSYAASPDLRFNVAGEYGVSLRVVTNPVRSDGGIAHLGFSVIHEKVDQVARFRTRPESHVTDIRLVDTGEVSDVEYQSIVGVELAGAMGGFTARLEGFVSQWDRDNAANNTFYGAYLELGHFFTGQNFRYRNGKFVRPEIAEGKRAWETGVRLSWVDLNDNDVRGGIQKNVGAALNWYPLLNTRLQFNLIYYDVERDTGDESGWIAQTRLQWNW